MNRMIAWTAIALFVVGCAGVQTSLRQEQDPSLSRMYDGHYDNNTFLVNLREMSLARIIESLYAVRTEVTFRTKEDGRLVKADLTGTAVVLFGKYLLTVEHVVSLEEMAAVTPFGRVVIPATKVSERTFLEHDSKRYELERLVVDNDMDVALFRLPEGLSLKSFPYRMGNSDDLQVGNFVYLVGNPMNIGINVREGIVSSLKAPAIVSRLNAVAENAFMVSNGLNPGDSGTPVIAIRDGVYELVGLSQGTFQTSQRLGWAIRINNILRRIEAGLGSPLLTMGRR